MHDHGERSHQGVSTRLLTSAEPANRNAPVDSRGRIYALNNGQLFAISE
jgi:hypothetical protein